MFRNGFAPAFAGRPAHAGRIPPSPPNKLLTLFIVEYILSIYKVYININNKNMNSTIINIKTDPKIKKEAKKITAEMGLTLSGAINGFLRQLIRSKNRALYFKRKCAKRLFIIFYKGI